MQATHAVQKVLPDNICRCESSGEAQTDHVTSEYSDSDQDKIDALFNKVLDSITDCLYTAEGKDTESATNASPYRMHSDEPAVEIASHHDSVEHCYTQDTIDILFNRVLHSIANCLSPQICDHNDINICTFSE